MNALCSFVFDADTSELLGDASVCTTEGSVLTIWLAGDVKIRPGQGLALGDVNTLFTSAFGAANLGGAPTFTGLLPRVAPCKNCSASAVDVRIMVSGRHCVRGRTILWLGVECVCQPSSLPGQCSGPEVA